MLTSKKSRNKLVIVGAVAIITLALVSAFLFYPTSGAPQGNLALNSQTFYRPTIARMYSFGTWSLPANMSAVNVGASLAKINASFVSGLIRFESTGLTLTPQMITDWNTVRTAVLAVNPNTKFDIWLRANQFTNPGTGASGNGADIVAAMQAIQQQNFVFNAFSFDDGNSMSTQAMQAVVAYAHSVHKLVGMGWVGPTVPAVKFDYIFIADTFNFTTNQDQILFTPAYISSLGVPVLLSINDGAEPVNANGITEHAWYADTIAEEGLSYMTNPQRINMLTFLYQQQVPLGYAFVTPAFWPVGMVGPPSIYYAPSATVFAAMLSLANTYNGRIGGGA